MSSEVQQLRERIELEMLAMRNGLTGLAVGVTRHQFIAARYQRLGQLASELATHVGEPQATQFSYQTYIRLVEGEGK